MNDDEIMVKNIDTVIFDLDGVIIDSAPDIVAAAQHVLQEFNCKVKDFDYIRGCIGGGARNLLLKCLDEDKKIHIDDAAKSFKAYYIENCVNKTVLYPGIKEILEYYSKRKKIALATFKIREATLRILKKLEIVDYFDVIVTADDVEKPKPDPQCINRILEELKCGRETAIIVGDTKTDLLTGKNAGIRTCAVLYGIGTEEEIRNCNPDYVLTDISGLKEIVI